MPDSGTFAGLSKKLDGFQRELSGKGTTERLNKLGKKFEPYVEQAVKGDFGDNSLSGWTRKAPVQVVGHAEKANSVEQGVFVSPAAAGARRQFGLGVMRVMSDGRRSYAAGDRRSSGWRTRKKDGARVQKFRKVKGTVGATKGRGTWSDAVELMDRNAARHVHSVIVEDTIRHYF